MRGVTAGVAAGIKAGVQIQSRPAAEKVSGMSQETMTMALSNAYGLAHAIAKTKLLSKSSVRGIRRGGKKSHSPPAPLAPSRSSHVSKLNATGDYILRSCILPHLDKVCCVEVSLIAFLVPSPCCPYSLEPAAAALVRDIRARNGLVPSTCASARRNEIGGSEQAASGGGRDALQGGRGIDITAEEGV